MSARTARRSFPAQLLVALARTSPAYAADPRPGRSRGRQLLAALARPPHSPSFPPASPHNELTRTSLGTDSGSAAASLLWSRPPSYRLALRSRPVARAAVAAFRVQLAFACARDLRFELDRVRRFAPGLAPNLDRALVDGRALEEALARAAANARARAVAHARFDEDPYFVEALSLDLTLTGARDLVDVMVFIANLDAAVVDARDLDSNFTSALASDLVSALGRLSALIPVLPRDGALERARVLARFLRREHILLRIRDIGGGPTDDLRIDSALTGASDLADDDARTSSGQALGRSIAAAIAFADALNDFTEADLRNADLAGLSLTGIRWSRATRWPPAWVEEIERLSVEIEPGIFEIRGGTATADTSTVLSGV